jgi:hypothetical protein
MQLASKYCEQEILVQRTNAPATLENGAHNGGGLRLDILHRGCN